MLRRLVLCGSLISLLAPPTARAFARDEFAPVGFESVAAFDPTPAVDDLAPLEPDAVFDHGGHAAPALRPTHVHRRPLPERRDLADKHVPAGLMGGHLHEQGEWMVEYKYMNMFMDGNRIGHRRVGDLASTGITVDGIATNFGASPTAMTMEMHMLHLMYGVRDDINLYAMLTFPSLTMDHVRGPGNPAGPGTNFTTQNSGLGDTTLGALIGLYEDCDEDLILNLACSVPTAEIRTTSSNPTGGRVEQVLPHPMRRGSGTFNAKPGLTYRKYLAHGSYGTQFQTSLPISRNYRGYRMGDEFRLNTWYSHLVTEDLALSIRLENLWQSTYQGFDPETPDRVISTNVEEFRGGYWLNLGLGGSLLVKGHLFSAEFIPTLYQDVHGIGLGTDWTMAASWSKSF